ncbi:MAG: family 10 glycosylhydrolase [Rhodothermales bacterium]
MSTGFFESAYFSVSRLARKNCSQLAENLFRYVAMLAVSLSASLLALPVGAQHPKHEMRGAWVATAYNLDWPFGLSGRNASSADQLADMATLFDDLASTGINAIFFQVRSEADAMYDSSIEPWSRFLTGTQGRAPDPFWDPLTEAINLAHERGMELHAWLNPFRVVSGLGLSGLAAGHIMNARPDLILSTTYKGTLESRKGTFIHHIDPGNPEGRAHIVRVVEDIVGRYPVDGIHFDDYFYPYPDYHISLEDQATFDAFGAGYASIEDWRRDNINLFMLEVSDAIRDIDPRVRFGVSPFGIWKPGEPAGIVGLDAFNVIYSDPLTWIIEESVDYLVPQLYWPIGGGQDFAALADWWDLNSEGIHIYPGIAAYKNDPTTAVDYDGDGVGDPWDGAEIPAQLTFGRLFDNIQGNFFFRARNLGPAINQGLTAYLATDFYRYKAITPYMEYRDTWPPDPPRNLQVSLSSEGRFLRWDPPLSGITFANRFAIYRVQSDGSTPDALAITNDPANLIHISWDPEWTDTAALEVGLEYHYVVTGLTPNSIESVDPDLATILIQGTAVEEFATSPALAGSDLYPNPASHRARLSLHLELPAEVDVRIVDMLGREVARPLGSASRQSVGMLDVDWDLRNVSGQRVAPGVYQIVIRAGRQQLVRSLVVLR